MTPLNVNVIHFDWHTSHNRNKNARIVVIDVLRATTSMAFALAHGAKEIVPVPSSTIARRIAKELPQAMLAGEEENKRIDGFDIGNSPLEYDERVRDRSIVMVTTNGTRVLAALRSEPVVWCGGFVNISAVASALINPSVSAVTIVCAGQLGQFSLEDFACAGALIATIDRQRGTNCDDAGLAARELYSSKRSNLLELISLGNHAKDLCAAGFASDVAVCARLDLFNILPVFSEGTIVADLLA